MKTIYNWLLQNTGNAGHYYTILNTDRETSPSGSDSLMIRARRTDDFTILNLLVFDGQKNDSSLPEQSGRVLEHYVLDTEQQLIDYLANGTKPDEPGREEASGIQVLVLEPTGEAGEIRFPE